MSFLVSKRLLLGASVLAAVVLAAGLWWFVWRPAGAARMLAYFPAEEAPLLYVDVGLLRKTGVLERLAGQAGVEEPEYRRFVEATGFDFRHDLDAVALLFRSTDRLLVVSGRFDLDKLSAYAKASGGRCAGALCSMQGSSVDRQVSWQPLAAGVLGVGVGRDPMAAAFLGGSDRKSGLKPPSAALWLNLPGRELRPGAGWPPGVSALLSALEGADRALLQATVQGSGLAIQLEAPCASQGKAAEIAARLVESTGTLKKLLARENKQPDPRNLSGVLAGGVFRSEGSVVRGSWPVSQEFLDALAK